MYRAHNGISTSVQRVHETSRATSHSNRVYCRIVDSVEVNSLCFEECGARMSRVARRVMT